MVRPTIFAATPRFYGILYNQYQQVVKDLVDKYKSNCKLEGNSKVRQMFYVFNVYHSSLHVPNSLWPNTLQYEKTNRNKYSS